MATTTHDQLIHVQPTIPTVRTIPVYACGGGGINIGAALSTLNAPTAEHAIPDVHYIDGSSQNLASIPEKDKDNVYIILELCPNLSLNDMLKRRKKLTDIEV